MTLDFLHVAKERGFLHQVTDENSFSEQFKSKKTLTAYAGFDPTGDSLHVGHLLPIMLLYWWQQCGHRPLILVGGTTAKIGDPSGKDEVRQMITDDVIAENVRKISSVFSKFIQFGTNPSDALLVNNADWLESLGYVSFLRDFGQHFTINRMLTFDNVKLRLEREQPLTFLEFNYMIFQAYDFLELHKKHGCVLQMGGSDQWGNIINGIELVRRVNQSQVFGLTCPLIMTSSGQKMGKTAKGAVWLSDHRLSPYDYWQFWRNTEDQDVGRFLKFFTTLPLSEIAKLEVLQGSELNEAKKVLANEATAFVHGRLCLDEIHQTIATVFGQGDEQNLSLLPFMTVTEKELDAGEILLIDALTSLGLSSSKAEARRLIQGNGVRLNDKPVTDVLLTLSKDQLNDGVIKLSAGKKRHAVVKIA